MLVVAEVVNSQDLRVFIDLPYRLYRKDQNYVPPLRSQIKDMLTGKDNMLFGYGPHALLLCRKQGRVVGRVMLGVDLTYNQVNGYSSAWFSLFECEPDEQAAEALLTAMERWALQQGADYLRGPESPDNGDSYKGFLVMGFEGPPGLMNSYNPPWYGIFLEKHGFEKNLDLYAYYVTEDKFTRKNAAKVIDYAMKRFGYHVDYVNFKQLDRDIRDIHEILVKTIPTFEEEHMSVPSLEDIDKFARSILPIADPGLICIARTNGDERPIGYVVALPEYNQVFRKIRDGRLLPFGFIKYLYYRRKINAIRVFMQFVVPEWQRKAVNNAMFHRVYQTAVAKGYHAGDGSTIGETNRQSRLSVEKLGGEHYRTYRLYKKKISAPI